MLYTADRERIFYTQDLKSDCGFDDECIFLKVRLWQFWNAWSTSVNPRDIFSHISPEKFLVIFLLSEPLTPLDSADWDTPHHTTSHHTTPHHTTPHHTTPHHITPDEDREWYFKQNIWLDCSQSCHCIARSPQSENNWHGKMPAATGSWLMDHHNLHHQNPRHDLRSQRKETPLLLL